jgi:DNA-binding SARP family transcriptional activator/streptogramin lyase
VAIATQLRISLLGSVSVVVDGRARGESTLAGRQNRLLFTYLAAELGKPVSRDALADALWGAEPPASWEKALTVIASKVRALLAEAGIDGGALASASGCYRLELPVGTWVDIFVAPATVDEAEAALRAGDLETAEQCAALAESLARLPFLAGEDGSWVEARRRELADVRVRALGVLSDAYLRAGNAAGAARCAGQAVVLEPFRESGYRSLMEAQVAAGNRAEALRVYERCRQLLAEELGAYPSPETEAIYRWLLAQPGDVGNTAILGEPLSRPSSRRRTAALAGAGLAIAAIVAVAVAIGGRGAPPSVIPNSLIRIDPHTLKVSRVIRVGDRPDLVVASGGYLWVTNHVLRGEESGALRNAGDRTLTRVDPSTGDAVVVGGGLAPCGLAAAPSGDVWVANCYTAGSGSRDNVVRVDVRTLEFKTTLPVVGGDGFYRGLAYGGGFLWISEVAGGDHPNPHAVIRIDPRTGAEHVYHLTREASGLAWSATGHDLWIVNFWNRSLMRLQSGQSAVQTIDAATPSPAFPVAEGNAVWLADWSKPQIVQLHAAGPPKLRRIVLPVHTASGVWAVAAGDSAVWAATPRDSALWEFDPATGKATRIPVRYAPSGVVAATSGIWVTIRKH